MIEVKDDAPMRAPRWLALAVALLLAFALQGVSRADATTNRAVGRACARPTNLGPPNAMQGAQIPTRRGSIWSLAFGPVPPKVGDQLKVVWRVTGSGPLKIHFTNPAGKRKRLEAGPTIHVSSNFNHPGDEYGTVFGFDEPGCWTIKLSRSNVKATVRVTAT
jgi:hypothetical protein